MTAEELRASAMRDHAPPAGLSLPLRALWWAAKGDWTRAHEVAQEGQDADAAWAHAWLHRQEGDLSNADYWYRRAGRQRSSLPLAEEWNAIVGSLLG
jgi:hypothetical protein